MALGVEEKHFSHTVNPKASSEAEPFNRPTTTSQSRTLFSFLSAFTKPIDCCRFPNEQTRNASLTDSYKFRVI